MAYRESRGFFSKIPLLKGKNFLQWDHEQFPGIIYRITNLDQDKVYRLKNFDNFVVAEYEDAAFLNHGKFVALAGPGSYELGSTSKQAGTEIIWISKRVIKSLWGVKECLTSDDVSIGGHGTAYIRIVNPESFIVSLVSGQRKFSEKKLVNS